MVLAIMVLVRPRPLISMPWWAPLGGVVGAGAAVADCCSSTRMRAGPSAALAVTADILMALAIVPFGMFDINWR